MQFRTDLAIEVADEAQHLTDEDVGKDTFREGDTCVTRLHIRTDRAARALGKPQGAYITVEVPPLTDNEETLGKAAGLVANELTALLPAEGSVLVVGLGNRAITPDALGPESADMVLATRHIGGEFARSVGLDDLRPTAVLTPGVLGQTGTESGEIVRGVCTVVHPVAVVVVVGNASIVPEVFRNIFASAFDFPAIFGGFTGSCMMEGIKRGLYSNEAGMGSAPNAAATADVSHPAKQGLVQMLAVFIDTLLICSATALMCLCSGVVPTPEAAGAPYVQAALQTALGDFGPVFIAVSMALFAFTTLIGNYYYCEGCLRFIFKRIPSHNFMTGFRIVAAIVVMLGAIITMQLAWDTADLFQALMVIINVPVILILSRTAVKVLKDYTTQRKAGKNPEFKSANVGLEGKTEAWE